MAESDNTPKDPSEVPETPPDVSTRDLHTAVNKHVGSLDAAGLVDWELGNIRETAGKTVKGVAENQKQLSPEQQEELLKTVKARFGANMKRHEGMEWSKVQAKLEANPEKLWSLNEMERTGGEPDVVDYDEKTGEYLFFDCSAESPEGRRNTVYDKKAEDDMAKYGEKCNGNAVDMAKAMGIEIPEKTQYAEIMERLYKLAPYFFGRESRDWIKTPDDIRKAGFALYGGRLSFNVGVDRAYARNAKGYLAFRGALRV